MSGQSSVLAVSQEPERINGWTVVRENDVVLVRDIDIAERAGLAQPRNIRAIIRKNRAELEEFGPLYCRTHRVRQSTGNGAERFFDVEEFWLNEDQSVSLVAMLRTPMARVLRVALVKLYGAFRRGEIVVEIAPAPAPQLPQSYLEALKQLVATVEEKEALAIQVETMRPTHEFGVLVGSTTNALSMGDVAKVFGMGRNTLFARLRELHIIQKAPSRVPYQEHLDAERFEVSETTYRTNTRGEQACPVTRVTAKGQQYIAKRLGLVSPPVASAANDLQLRAGGEE